MNYFKIGQIVNTHGIKGEIKINPYTDDIVKLSRAKSIYFESDLTTKVQVEYSKIISSFVIFKLKGIDTPEEASKLKQKYIYIERNENEKLEEDTYYIDDLIGLQVISIDNNSVIGTISYIFNTGANDIYEVKLNDGKNAYLPAIKDVIKKVDIEDKKVYVKLMEGLL
jgi:16S rRNA processing protein RimM